MKLYRIVPPDRVRMGTDIDDVLDKLEAGEESCSVVEIDQPEAEIQLTGIQLALVDLAVTNYVAWSEQNNGWVPKEDADAVKAQLKDATLQIAVQRVMLERGESG